MKNICVIGTGYVGVVAAIGLADFGHSVHAVDIDEQKISSLQKGIPPFYEQEVAKRLLQNTRTLRFSTEVAQAVQDADIIFIAIGSPFPNAHYPTPQEFFPALDIIARNLQTYKIIVTKSTVAPGSNKEIYEYLHRQNPDAKFDVVANPEFLREGSALPDFLHPHKVVIGYENPRIRKIIEEVYRPLQEKKIPFVWGNWATAELVKYACNAFLATKITFINQMNALAIKMGAETAEIVAAMGLDDRISGKFLRPGPGYGGSCFPKDLRMISHVGTRQGVDMSLIKEVDAANERQKSRPLFLLQESLGLLKNKRIAILGLTFKPQTDDIRESPSLTLVEHILHTGAQVQAYDPEGMNNFSREYPQLSYGKDAYATLQDADAAVIMTTWDEFRNLDFPKVKKIMRFPLLIDPHRLLPTQVLHSLGFHHHR